MHAPSPGSSREATVAARITQPLGQDARQRFWQARGISGRSRDRYCPPARGLFSWIREDADDSIET